MLFMVAPKPNDFDQFWAAYPRKVGKLAAVIGRLDRVQFPSDISFHRGGKAIATAVRPAGRDAEQSYQSRLWRFDRGGAATQLTHGPNGD